MNFKEQIGKSIMALLLLAAIMLPSAIQFSHIFDEHEHRVCTEHTTHIHEADIKCDICSFHLTSFNYDIAQYPNLILPKIPVKIEVNFASLKLHSFKITNTQLRAPPIFS